MGGRRARCAVQSSGTSSVVGIGGKSARESTRDTNSIIPLKSKEMYEGKWLGTCHSAVYEPDSRHSLLAAAVSLRTDR